MKIIENTMENYEVSKAEGYGSQVLSGIYNTKRICYNIGCTEGSEKQIEWADSIKHGWLSEIIKNQGIVIQQGRTTPEKALENICKLTEKLEAMTDARKIINMRDMSTMSAIQQIMRG